MKEMDALPTNTDFVHSNHHAKVRSAPKLTFFRYTTNKRITREAQRATTNRIMIDGLAACAFTTNWRCAWINTLMIDTCSIEGTFWIYGTFWSTSRRTANKIFNACANGTPVVLFALRVRAARRWLAYMNFWFWNYGVAAATTKQTNKQK